MIISGFLCKSGLTLRPILLLSSVCAFLIVLNCDKAGIKCDKYSVKGYQGHVSPFKLPTRHESVSALQNANANIYDKYDKNGYNLSNSGNHFKQTFSVI